MSGSDEMRQLRIRQYQLSIRRFLIFFGLIAFVLTCNFVLFLNFVDLEREQLEEAAPLTFINVIFLTLIFCTIDGLRRKWSIERPVKRILEAADKITKEGDFSVRIQPIHDVDTGNEFDLIIDRLNQMTEELSGVETLRSDFIANVSHELKTPLAVMQNYGILLQQPNLPEETRLEYAKAITETSRRLADLITNVLKLNRLENQQIYPEVRTYNLSEQICECFLVFEDAWEKKELEIETDIEEDVMVTADPELLSLIWNNLLSNAIKFTDNGGRIFVGLKKEMDFTVVTVSDTGCGMSADVGNHIFEKFYQGDTSHATQGNGLGLALVKRIIDITKADISVSSTLHKGSTFTVKIRDENR